MLFAWSTSTLSSPYCLFIFWRRKKLWHHLPLLSPSLVLRDPDPSISSYRYTAELKFFSKKKKGGGVKFTSEESYLDHCIN